MGHYQFVMVNCSYYTVQYTYGPHSKCVRAKCMGSKRVRGMDLDRCKDWVMDWVRDWVKGRDWGSGWDWDRGRGRDGDGDMFRGMAWVHHTFFLCILIIQVIYNICIKTCG